MQILKIIALLIEYPDELLWENRDEALSLVEQDAPMLLSFAQQHLSAPLLDKQAEWCEVFERGRATSLLLPAFSLTAASCRTICRSIWNISVSSAMTRRVKGCKTSRRSWR